MIYDTPSFSASRGLPRRPSLSLPLPLPFLLAVVVVPALSLAINTLGFVLLISRTPPRQVDWYSYWICALFILWLSVIFFAYSGVFWRALRRWVERSRFSFVELLVFCTCASAALALLCASEPTIEITFTDVRLGVAWAGVALVACMLATGGFVLGVLTRLELPVIARVPLLGAAALLGGGIGDLRLALYVAGCSLVFPMAYGLCRLAQTPARWYRPSQADESTPEISLWAELKRLRFAYIAVAAALPFPLVIILSMLAALWDGLPVTPRVCILGASALAVYVMLRRGSSRTKPASAKPHLRSAKRAGQTAIASRG